MNIHYKSLAATPITARPVSVRTTGAVGAGSQFETLPVDGHVRVKGHLGGDVV